jgi:hypothetical protein
VDLSDATLLVGTGGPLVRRRGSENLLARALGRAAPGSLCPRAPRVVVDHSYLLAAAGLLSRCDRDAARALLQNIRRDHHVDRGA